MPQRSDEQLMRDYARGDVQAFEALFRRHGQKIYNLFLRFSGDPQLAEDLLQECFLRVIEARDRYRSENAFDRWLITIAINLLRDHHRRSRRRNEKTMSEEPVAPDAGNPAGTNPQLDLERRYLQDAVQKALLSLPAEQREVILLSKYYGFSFAEIADMLNITPAAAKQKAYRGMLSLRKKLAYLKEQDT